jgi:hypothetical protein
MSVAIIKPRFSLPATASDGAWCLTIALVERANFNQEAPTSELLLADLFPASEQLDTVWKQEMTGRASGFNILVYEEVNFKKSDFDSMSMFYRLSYRDNPSRIEAEFNSKAQYQLQQLRICIRQLTDLHQLRPASLQARLKATAPLTVFNMKKDKHYNRPVAVGLRK